MTGEDFTVLLQPGARRRLVYGVKRLKGPVSVRSSMIGEDSAARSYAGQLETSLDVSSPKDLFEAIRRCYASVEQESFRRYTEKAPGNGESSPGALAILIQKMVPSKTAGVAFSADPNMGVRRIIIEAARGPGESLASGRVVPDRIIVDPAGFGIRRDAAPGTEPVLDETQIRRLAELIQRIHRLMGCPQDIEWAWDGARFWVLQSRPITSLQNQHLYSSRLVSDMTPGLIKPLLWSTSIADMMSNVFARIFESLLGTGLADPAAIIRRFHSRIYADMSRFGELLERIGLPANFFEMITYDELPPGGRPRINARLVRSAPRLLLFIARYGRIGQSSEKFIRLHGRRLKRIRKENWHTRQPEELLDLSLDLREYHGQTQWYMWLTAINMMVRKKLLSRFLERNVPGVTTHQLLSGLAGLKSLEPNQLLKAMAAKTARVPPADRQTLLQGDDRIIRERLGNTPGGRKLLEYFEDFMDRYGFLSSSGTDFTVTPWSERPELIWKGLGRLAGDGKNQTEPDAALVRKRAHERARSSLSGLKRWWFERLLRSTGDHVRLRERIGLFMSEDIAHMRRLYLTMGQHMTLAGRLPQPDDLFYLFSDELASLIDGSADAGFLRKRISQQKEILERDAAIEPEEVFYGTPRQWTPACETAGEPYLEGIIGSFGMVRGYARIVHDPGQLETPLTKRDILVVPHTDVGWTPLFPSIGGLVAETGGQLSHSAIVAREYGLPAVVSVPKATRIIREGQPITLDGDRGRVYLKHIAAGEGTDR